MTTDAADLLVVKHYAPFQRLCTLRDALGVPYDLTDAVITSHARASSRGPLAFQFAASVTDALAGQFLLALDEPLTPDAVPAGLYEYDVRIFWPGNPVPSFTDVLPLRVERAITHD